VVRWLWVDVRPVTRPFAS